MIRVLIVDDEPLARALLKSLIERDPDLRVAGECADGPSALHDIERLGPDLVFLDVQMPTMTGVEVAERLPAHHRCPYVVFVTAFDVHAVRAFELHALDYLVKPIHKARFFESVTHAKKVIRQGALSRLSERLLAVTESFRAEGNALGDSGSRGILVRRGDTIDRIEPGTIEWVEAANQYVTIHTGSESYTLSESLSAFLRRVSHPELIRVHRSAAIHPGRVQRVVRKPNGTHEIQLDSGTVVPLSRRRRDLVSTILGRSQQLRQPRRG